MKWLLGIALVLMCILPTLACAQTRVCIDQALVAGQSIYFQGYRGTVMLLFNSEYQTYSIVEGRGAIVRWKMDIGGGIYTIKEDTYGCVSVTLTGGI